MMQILVVDDEQDVELLFKQVFFKELRNGTLLINFAFTGEEALRVLEQNLAEVVLILSDINMPGMSGLELLRIVKERHPSKNVYMITAYGNEENFRKAEQFGADGYLTKPIDFDELRSKIFDVTKS